MDPYWVAGLAFTVGGLVGGLSYAALAHYRRHLNRRRKSDPTLADLRALRQDIAIVAAHLAGYRKDVSHFIEQAHQALLVAHKTSTTARALRNEAVENAKALQQAGSFVQY
jgi:hypothetical protein